MTGESEKRPPEREPLDEELDAEALAELEKADKEGPPLKALLKRSLAAGAEPAPAETPTPAEPDRLLLQGVQKKLRQRSKGKFYADGWSTTQSRMNYGLIAGVMLVVIVAVYLALGPMGISLH